MNPTRCLAFASLALSIVACVGTVPLDDKACPCATGSVCCPTTNKCMAAGEVCGGPTIKSEATGQPCNVAVDAGTNQAVYNASAVTCPSNICLKPVVESAGNWMPNPATQATCTAECTQDSDCEGELRDTSNPLDRRCKSGFTCGVPFVKGELCCKRLCMCNDFSGPDAVTPLACQGGGAATCDRASNIPISSVLGVGQQTDYYVNIAPNRMLDMVFMIDNSPSMAAKQAKMTAQFPKLIGALKDPDNGILPDLRVAIIDGDLGTGGAYAIGSCSAKILPDGIHSYYGDLGRFQMINATSCGVGSPNAQFLEYKSGAPVNFTGDLNNVFACLAGNLGTLGCGEQHQLQALEFALAAKGIGNEAQQTAFLRPNATLGLIFLSDEDDCSAATNDGMFGTSPGGTNLATESASLRCSTRSHTCSGANLSDSGPGYPTTHTFSTALTNCSARTDACPNPTDGEVSTDTSVPTSCSPLKSVKTLADHIKGLKSSTDQILVAGIFGWPLSDSDMASAQYKIDQVPNPTVQDTAHPTIYDSWPVCYDPLHKPSGSSFDATAAGWGAAAGLREAAFIDQFGSNGLKFSICQTDFSDSMQAIGDALAQKMQNPCIADKLVDADIEADGLQPDCRVVYQLPLIDPNNPSGVVYSESAEALPLCPDGATSANASTDCWRLTNDISRCPVNGQRVDVVRPATASAATLQPGTKLKMQCRTCPSTPPGTTVLAGCDY